MQKRVSKTENRDITDDVQTLAVPSKMNLENDLAENNVLKYDYQREFEEFDRADVQHSRWKEEKKREPARRHKKMIMYQK